jgi:predicted kinase
MDGELGVVAIMGLPGAGKTTLASPLASALNAWIVSRDGIRRAMFEPCEFTETEKQAAFQGVLAAVSANCELGRVSVIDGMPFSRIGESEAVVGAAARHGLGARGVFLAISPDAASDRIAQQTEARDLQPHNDRTEHLPSEVSARLREPPSDALVLDAQLPPPELLRATLDWISTRESAPRARLTAG